jgi:hypothetical protein
MSVVGRDRDRFRDREKLSVLVVVLKTCFILVLFLDNQTYLWCFLSYRRNAGAKWKRKTVRTWKPKPTLKKTDGWSVFGIRKTNRFWSRFRFPGFGLPLGSILHQTGLAQNRFAQNGFTQNHCFSQTGHAQNGIRMDSGQNGSRLKFNSVSLQWPGAHHEKSGMLKLDLLRIDLLRKDLLRMDLLRMDSLKIVLYPNWIYPERICSESP